MEWRALSPGRHSVPLRARQWPAPSRSPRAPRAASRLARVRQLEARPRPRPREPCRLPGGPASARRERDSRPAVRRAPGRAGGGPGPSLLAVRSRGRHRGGRGVAEDVPPQREEGQTPGVPPPAAVPRQDRAPALAQGGDRRSHGGVQRGRVTRRHCERLRPQPRPQPPASGDELSVIKCDLVSGKHSGKHSATAIRSSRPPRGLSVSRHPHPLPLSCWQWG